MVENTNEAAKGLTATYSPEDNKLRLYCASRLDDDTVLRVNTAGFRWAPAQKLFVAPMWTPDRADLLIELCGDIGDEDTSLVERSEERAERFEDYGANRAKDAEDVRQAVSRIADHIPMGQPILVGHHSERHARRDAERIQEGMRRAIKMWETAHYWQQRATAALRHAEYKERPDVRARRIKTLEAEKRKQERARDRSRHFIAAWEKLGLTKDRQPLSPENVRPHAIYIANVDRGYYRSDHVFPSGYVGPLSLWEAAGGSIHDVDPDAVAIATPQEVRDQAIKNHQGVIAWAERWIQHHDLRLEYERTMLHGVGGTIADRTGPEKGGACRCWASPRGGWSYIQKVNKVSVTVLDNWGNGGPNFGRTIPFDKLTAVMTKAEVDAARDAGRLLEAERDAVGTALGFYLRETAPTECTSGPVTQPTTHDKVFEAMRITLQAGVQVVAAPSLFPTPSDVAARMIELAGIEADHRVLEPSAGTGTLLDAILDARATAFQPIKAGEIVAVEANMQLADRLRGRYPSATVWARDFLELTVGDIGIFDRVLMNPPFDHGSDIEHIMRALDLLKPGGRLVAICANGPRQQEKLRPLVTAGAGWWEELPTDTFKAAGTTVRTVVLMIPRYRAL